MSILAQDTILISPKTKKEFNERITKLEVAPDVADLVGTYAELESYDTSKLREDDIIEVLQDETKGEANTYYRWSLEESSWSYVGEKGPHYTKSEADALYEEERDARVQRDIELTEALDQEIQDRIDDVDTEETRAKAAEKKLTEDLEAEVIRATEAENDLSDALDIETERAKTAEETLDKKLNKEIQDRVDAIEAEKDRAESIEQSLRDDLTSETLRAEQAESALNNKINDEVIRAEDAEKDLDDKIEQEIEDRKSEIASEAKEREDADKELDDKVDQEIQDRIDAVDTEQTRAEDAEETLDTKIDTETTRATNAESTLNDKISQEVQDRVNAINNEKARAEDAESALQSDLKDVSESIKDATLTIQRNDVTACTFSANASNDVLVNIEVPTQASDVHALPDTTKYAANLDVSLDSDSYVVTMQLKDQEGNNLGSARDIDLPLETMVVDGRYDASTKEVVLELKSGTDVRFSVADLVAGLQTEITSSERLDADLVVDNESDHKFVSETDIDNWNSKQDYISDLNDIRNQAENGNSAYSTIQGYGDIVTRSASEFLTEHQDLSGKQDVITDLDTIRYNAEYGESAYNTVAGYGDIVTHNADEFLTDQDIEGKANSADLATVATSGSYDDLADKPELIEDVQVNGTSVVTNGVANITIPSIPEVPNTSEMYILVWNPGTQSLAWETMA